MWQLDIRSQFLRLSFSLQEKIPQAKRQTTFDNHPLMGTRLSLLHSSTESNEKRDPNFAILSPQFLAPSQPVSESQNIDSDTVSRMVLTLNASHGQLALASYKFVTKILAKLPKESQKALSRIPKSNIEKSMSYVSTLEVKKEPPPSMTLITLEDIANGRLAITWEVITVQLVVG